LAEGSAQHEDRDVSSIAVDAQDNIWTLNRPRTLKDADKAMAAKPIVIFSANGDFSTAVTGADGPSGYEWPRRDSTAFSIDRKASSARGIMSPGSRSPPVADDH